MCSEQASKKAVVAPTDENGEKPTSPKKRGSTASNRTVEEAATNGSPAKKAAKPKKAPAEKAVLVRTETPKQPDPPSQRFLAMAWNITTIRSLVSTMNGQSGDVSSSENVLSSNKCAFVHARSVTCSVLKPRPRLPTRKALAPVADFVLTCAGE
eukprot:1011791-Pyramimonas_sp.AAC.2